MIDLNLHRNWDLFEERCENVVSLLTQYRDMSKYPIRLSRITSKGTFPQLTAVNVLKSEAIVWKFKCYSSLPCQSTRVAARTATWADCYLFSFAPCNSVFLLFHLPVSLGFIIVNNSFLGPRERGDVSDLALSSTRHIFFSLLLSASYRGARRKTKEYQCYIGLLQLYRRFA